MTNLINSTAFAVDQLQREFNLPGQFPDVLEIHCEHIWADTGAAEFLTKNVPFTEIDSADVLMNLYALPEAYRCVRLDTA